MFRKTKSGSKNLGKKNFLKDIWARKKLSTKIKAPMALKNLGYKTYLVKKTFGPNNIWGHKNFVPKNIVYKN